MQNELPVYEAIGGAAKMTAQYAADYANWMDKGKTETEATALAASSMRNAQAQAISSAQQSTQNMQQQNELLQAGIGLQGIKQIAAQGAVQEQQTFNDVLANTGDKETALNASLEQRKNIELKIQDTRAKANASVNELTRSMEQQTELVIA